MRFKSNKTAKVDRAIKAERDAYREEFYICQVCNKALADDLHEIARGSHRAVAKLERCCWLAVCRRDHDYLDDYSIWPLTRQLAVKLLNDPLHFDLKKFNQIRGRAEGAIDLADVVQHLTLKG